MFPFKEEIIEEHDEWIKVKRTFNAEEDDESLNWHRDAEDRYVSLVEGDEWYLQMDEKIPQVLSVEQKYFIPKNTWHRLINKNRSNLVIEVKKIK